MNKLQRLEKAIKEAMRFLAAAKPASENYEKFQDRFLRMNGKLNGAAERTSMDLTRALAEYRRPAR